MPGKLQYTQRRIAAPATRPPKTTRKMPHVINVAASRVASVLSASTHPPKSVFGVLIMLAVGSKRIWVFFFEHAMLAPPFVMLVKSTSFDIVYASSGLLGITSTDVAVCNNPSLALSQREESPFTQKMRLVCSCCVGCCWQLLWDINSIIVFLFKYALGMGVEINPELNIEIITEMIQCNLITEAQLSYDIHSIFFINIVSDSGPHLCPKYTQAKKCQPQHFPHIS